MYDDTMIDSNGDRDNSEVWMILDVLLENEIGQQQKGMYAKNREEKKDKNDDSNYGDNMMMEITRRFGCFCGGRSLL